MNYLMNLTACACDVGRFHSARDLSAFLAAHGLEGIELMPHDDALLPFFSGVNVLGVHLRYDPCWVDFWRGDWARVEREFGDRETAIACYGGETRDALILRTRRELDLAARLGARYVVFHAADVSIRESLTFQFEHSDEEVIDAAVQWINAALGGKTYPFALLIENLWWPGLNLLDPALTARLLDGIRHPDVGLMLDIGHALHTNRALTSEADAIAHVHQLLDAHGDLARRVRGIHLHGCLSGAAINRLIADPPELTGDYRARLGRAYEEILKIDRHQPLTDPSVQGLIKRINPDFVTMEFISTSRAQHSAMLAAQNRALGRPSRDTGAAFFARAHDAKAEAAARARWDGIAKPLHSLGKLEALVSRMAGIQGTEHVDASKKRVLVLCADNGVVAEGVSQSGNEVTALVARNIADGTGNVAVMARAAGAQVIAVDVGMATDVDHPAIRRLKVAYGTGNIAVGPAMTRDQALTAIGHGVELALESAREGVSLLATGEMGIGNTTTSSAIASVLLNQPIERMTGRGAGLNDEGLQRKIGAIRRAIAVNRPDPSDALDVLSKLGGYDIAAMAGVFLGGAQCGVPVVLDGFISGVAALIAARLCPEAARCFIPSHVSREPAGPLILRALGLDPILHADMSLGEGTGAVALFPLIDLALAVYRQSSTFEALHLDAYQPQVEPPS